MIVRRDAACSPEGLFGVAGWARASARPARSTAGFDFSLKFGKINQFDGSPSKRVGL